MVYRPTRHEYSRQAMINARQLLLCSALFINALIPPSVCFAAETAPAAPTSLPALQKFGSSRMWFYSAIIPYALQDSSFLALSISPDGVHNPPKEKSKDDLLDPIWLDFWKEGDSNLAQLRLGSYDFARDVPQPISTEEDLYLFFLRSAQSIRDDAPVVRRTPGGWAWQRLDTVEKAIKSQVRVADFSAGKLLDANGQTLADLKAVNRAFLKYALPPDIVDLGCRLQDGEGGKRVLGVAALLPKPKKSAPLAVESARPQLPYREVFLYSASATDVNDFAKVTRLGLAESPDGQVVSGPIAADAPLEIRASYVADDESVSFGKPIIDAGSGRVYYWYCIQSGARRGWQTFVLACFDGRSTRVIDGYAVRLPSSIRFWSGGTWSEQTKDLTWLYGAATKIAVQPVVGFNDKGALVAYRYGDWLRQTSP